MTPKLLIVTDLGLLKAFTLNTTTRGTPRLEPLEERLLTDAHQRVVDRVSDFAGRRAAPRGGGGAAPTADAHNLKLETRRRLVKQIAAHIRRLAGQHPEAGLWLAAPRQINHFLCDALPAPVFRRLELILARDLVKASKTELLGLFGPLLYPARAERPAAARARR